MTEQEAINEILAINSLFKNPLTDGEARAKAKHIYKKFKSQVLKKANPKQKYEYHDRYLFKNDTIIQRLNITKDEMKLMATIIDQREKYDRNNERRRNERRDENGNLISKVQIQERRFKVKELMDQGLGYKRIAKTLGISENTAKNDVRALKK